jgi:hypothetical protein
MIEVGPFSVRESISKPSVTPGWIEDTYGWQQIIDDYSKLTDVPIILDWVQLYMDVMSILPDDLDRADGVNYFSDKDSGPKIRAAFLAVQDCLVKDSCSQIDFEGGDLSWLKDGYFYGHYLKKIDNADSVEQKREIMKRFVDRLAVDSWKYNFQVNPLVTRPTNDLFVLPFLLWRQRENSGIH